MGIISRGILTSSMVCIAAVNLHVSVVTNVFSVAQCDKTFFSTAHAGRNHATVTVRGMFGNNVNNTIDRIGAPKCGPWPPNNLNPFYIFKWCGLMLPVHT